MNLSLSTPVDKGGRKGHSFNFSSPYTADQWFKNTAAPKYRCNGVGLRAMVERLSPTADPHAPMTCSDMMLAEEGSMKSLEEVDRIVSLMQESQKMVSRCIYLNIVKSTADEEILKKFISIGGWDILNTWLHEAKLENNIPLLTEILKVYNQLPVNLELLKQNNCAKTIKHLTRLDDEGVKNLSNDIVNSWMKTIKHKNEGSSEKPKKKTKKHHQKYSASGESNLMKDNDSRESMDSNGETSPNNNSNDSNDKTMDDSKETSPNNASVNLVTKRKTAKTAPSKFRSTGNNDDENVGNCKRPVAIICVTTSFHAQIPILRQLYGTRCAAAAARNMMPTLCGL
ncbi:hypothetical protein LSH36_21g02059 [Paralvinella palmiformis]|uniref:TFIIS N-terminal domain-containing protein n=1 Tax=Paralvinella palmiformis TaxID=53620 RepID=A0AAD9KB16_9ANNE|nr:hypothetical protein LSH36_21g02059 [Paralvinella palmiformis]